MECLRRTWVSQSIRIGAGQSLRQLKKQKGLFKKLVNTRPYQPDELLAGLSPFLGDAALRISGFHLYSSPDVERTENWREETFKKFNM